MVPPLTLQAWQSLPPAHSRRQGAWRPSHQRECAANGPSCGPLPPLRPGEPGSSSTGWREGRSRTLPVPAARSGKQQPAEEQPALPSFWTQPCRAFAQRCGAAARLSAQGAQRFVQSGSGRTFWFGCRRIQPEAAPAAPSQALVVQHAGFGTSPEWERFPATRHRATAAAHSTLLVHATARSRLSALDLPHACAACTCPKVPRWRVSSFGHKSRARGGSQPRVCFLTVNTESISVWARRAAAQTRTPRPPLTAGTRPSPAASGRSRCPCSQTHPTPLPPGEGPHPTSQQGGTVGNRGWCCWDERRESCRSPGMRPLLIG